MTPNAVNNHIFKTKLWNNAITVVHEWERDEKTRSAVVTWGISVNLYDDRYTIEKSVYSVELETESEDGETSTQYFDENFDCDFKDEIWEMVLFMDENNKITLQ